MHHYECNRVTDIQIIYIFFTAIGLDDGVNILFDTDELTSLPIIGDQLKSSAQRMPIPVQRAKQGATEAEDFFIQPLSIPKSLAPQRIYFLFGKPIDLCNDPEFANIRDDPDAANELYRKIQDDVSCQLSYLLSEREGDVYKDFPRRYAYESVYDKQAPTFL